VAFLHSDQANATPGMTMLLQLIGMSAKDRDAWIAAATRLNLVKSMRPAQTLFMQIHPWWGGTSLHAWFDAELSSTKGLIGRRELDENSWLYHMNQYIMPVAAPHLAVDLGNLKPKNELWAGTQIRLMEKPTLLRTTRI